MKKLITIVLAIAMIMTAAISFAESTDNKAKDATYEYLFSNLLDVVSTDGSNSTLKLQNATVWKVNDSLAGFMFEGDEWIVIGEAFIENGLIYKINARFPYNVAGILATRLIAYTLSEMPSWDMFTANYTSEDAILTATPMKHYVNTLNSGNTTTMIFEFTRIVDINLNDQNNAFNMANTIKTMQNIQ